MPHSPDRGLVLKILRGPIVFKLQAPYQSKPEAVLKIVKVLRKSEIREKAKNKWIDMDDRESLLVNASYPAHPLDL